MAKVMVVDDDPLFRSLLKELLELDGHEVVEAEDGLQAVGLYAHRPCDLVITDILMPGGDGLEAIRGLRKVDPRAKIIAASGGGWQAAEEYLETAAQLGAARSLIKPFDNEELRAAVRETIG